MVHHLIFTWCDIFALSITHLCCETKKNRSLWHWKLIIVVCYVSSSAAWSLAHQMNVRSWPFSKWKRNSNGRANHRHPDKTLPPVEVSHFVVLIFYSLVDIVSPLYIYIDVSFHINYLLSLEVVVYADYERK